MSALLFAYCPAANAMARERLADVAVNDRVDALRARGLEVSVHWLDPDAPPSVEKLLSGILRGES